MFFKRHEIGALVRMDEKSISGEPLGMVDLYEPVAEGEAPNLDQIQRMVRFIHEQMELWERPLAVSSHDGGGQADLVLSCYMVSVGYSAEKAVDHVRRMRSRPDSLRSATSKDHVAQFDAWWTEQTAQIRRKASERFQDY